MTDNQKIYSAYISINENEERFNLYKKFYRKDAFAITFPARGYAPSKLLENRYDDSILTPLSESKEAFLAINHPSSLSDAIREDEHDCVILDEGLITSVDNKQFVEIYKTVLVKYCPNLADIPLRTFDNAVPSSAKLLDCTYYNEKNPSLIAVPFPVDMTEVANKDANTKKAYAFKSFSDAIDHMFVAGWNFSYADLYRTAKLKNGTVLYLYMLAFEKKYHTMEVELPETLYHVVPKSRIEKVVRQGLVPKESVTDYGHPSRVYLFGNETLNNIERFGLKKIASLKNMKSRSKVDDDGFYIIKIKKSSIESYKPYIDKRLVFYFDPMFRAASQYGLDKSPAYFTYGNIPKQLIEREAYYYNLRNGGLNATSRQSVSLPL